VASWPSLDDQLLADAAATFHWRLGVPVPLAIARDGAVLFRRTPPRGFASDLYELAPDGALRTLATADDLLGAGDEQLSDAERARRERTRTATRGVVDVWCRSATGCSCSTAIRAPRRGRARSIRAARSTIRTCRPTGRWSRSCATATCGSRRSASRRAG
jgi:hypothetical protein